MRVPHSVLEAGITAKYPTYVYDLARLRARCALLEAIPIARKSIFFATMANDHPAVLSCIRDQGHGVFVNSPRHLGMALDLGFAPGSIVYAASSMTLEEIDVCIRAGVHVVLDSIDQIREFARAGGAGREIGLRVNVGSALDGRELKLDVGYRFGVLEEELPEAVAVARGHGVRIAGVHSYFGTDLMDERILLSGLKRLGRVATALPGLRYIDAGGGFGVCGDDRPTEFDIAAYGCRAADIMAGHERRLGRPLELFIEPGRYLVADCGFFFVQVVDRKLRTDRAFIGTKASVAQFPRPLMYPETAVHPCAIVGRPEGAPNHDLPIWLCGNSTYSRDFLARERRMALPEIGDIVVFGNAGAYCRSMITDFLGKDRPVEIVLDTAEHRFALPYDASRFADNVYAND